MHSVKCELAVLLSCAHIYTLQDMKTEFPFGNKTSYLICTSLLDVLLTSWQGSPSSTLFFFQLFTGSRIKQISLNQKPIWFFSRQHVWVKAYLQQKKKLPPPFGCCFNASVNFPLPTAPNVQLAEINTSDSHPQSVFSFASSANNLKFSGFVFVLFVRHLLALNAAWRTSSVLESFPRPRLIYLPDPDGERGDKMWRQ